MRSGDGNLSPFQGDRGNELYLRITVAATILALDVDDAQMRLEMPEGYECLDGLNVRGPAKFGGMRVDSSDEGLPASGRSGLL